MGAAGDYGARVLNLLVNTMDQSLLLLPARPCVPKAGSVYTYSWPGAVILTLVVVFLTGVLAANFIGQKLVSFWEGVLLRIPVVNSIYKAVKQVSDTLFSGSGRSVSKGAAGTLPASRSFLVAGISRPICPATSRPPIY